MKEAQRGKSRRFCMISLIRARCSKVLLRKEDRSLMNVPFVTGDKDLDAKFVAEAKAAGFENLKRTPYRRRYAC